MGRPLYATDKDLEALHKLLRSAYRRFYLRPQFVRDRLAAFLRGPGPEMSRNLAALNYFIRKHLA